MKPGMADKKSEIIATFWNVLWSLVRYSCREADTKRQFSHVILSETDAHNNNELPVTVPQLGTDVWGSLTPPAKPVVVLKVKLCS